jgi:hypothetical protein
MTFFIKTQLFAFLYAIIGELLFELVYHNDQLLSNSFVIGISIILGILYAWIMAKFLKHWTAIVVLPISYVFYSIVILFFHGWLFPTNEEDPAAGILMFLIHSPHLLSICIGSLLGFILITIRQYKAR